MKFLDTIKNAVNYLNSKDVENDKMIIAFSPLLFELFKQKMPDAFRLCPPYTLFNCEIYTKHPYNEIVVYVPERWHDGEDYMVRIVIENFRTFGFNESKIVYNIKF